MPLLRSPEVMNRARAMGDYLRFKSTLPARLSEFMILLTAREWTQQYEWEAHSKLALKAGVSAETVDAIAQGRRPEHLTDDERGATGPRPGHSYVYRRAGEPCRVCGTRVRMRELQARNLYWCAGCQPRFRSRAVK